MSVAAGLQEGLPYAVNQCVEQCHALKKWHVVCKFEETMEPKEMLLSHIAIASCSGPKRGPLRSAVCHMRTGSQCCKSCTLTSDLPLSRPAFSITMMAGICSAA